MKLGNAPLAEAKLGDTKNQNNRIDHLRGVYRVECRVAVPRANPPVDLFILYWPSLPNDRNDSQYYMPLSGKRAELLSIQSIHVGILGANRGVIPSHVESLHSEEGHCDSWVYRMGMDGRACIGLVYKDCNRK